MTLQDCSRCATTGGAACLAAGRGGGDGRARTAPMASRRQRARIIAQGFRYGQKSMHAAGQALPLCLLAVQSF